MKTLALEMNDIAVQAKLALDQKYVAQKIEEAKQKIQSLLDEIQKKARFGIFDWQLYLIKDSGITSVYGKEMYRGNNNYFYTKDQLFSLIEKGFIVTKTEVTTGFFGRIKTKYITIKW